MNARAEEFATKELINKVSTALEKALDELELKGYQKARLLSEFTYETCLSYM